MSRIQNPCLNDVTKIVQALYDRGIIYFDDIKDLSAQINNEAWSLYGSGSYREYINDALQAASTCENLNEFRRMIL